MQNTNDDGVAHFSAAHWVPPDRMALWQEQDPYGAEEILDHIDCLFSPFMPQPVANPEDELTVFRLVLAGGDEVSLLQLVASGLIANVEAFIKAAVLVKRRRAGAAILELPMVEEARERLVASLGPLGWETPDRAACKRVMDALGALEGVLMTWLTIRPAATLSAMEDFAREVIHRTDFGVGRATSTM